MTEPGATGADATEPGATGVAILGCGLISTAYLQRLTTLDGIRVVACADVVPERAAAQASAFAVPTACSPDELLDNPDVDVVVNLTIPAVHAPLTAAALDAGKSVYSEKPVALTREDAQALLLLAAKQGLRLGSAPDTFLGAGLQTCRALLDEGAVGEPLAATAFMMGSGPESWHPDPAFFYKEGAGPLFDMGVYYLTALVSLLGPARRVSASARISRAERTITSKPLAGTTIKVDVPTHVSASIDFEAGPLATLVTSFDVHGSTVPRIEIYGTEGTLSVPDPNTFGGPVRVWSRGGTEWREVALRPGFAEQSRGIGVVEMVDAARTGRPHRANGELAVHVVDIMQSVYESSDRDQSVLLATTCQRPAPFLPG